MGGKTSYPPRYPVISYQLFLEILGNLCLVSKLVFYFFNVYIISYT